MSYGHFIGKFRHVHRNVQECIQVSLHPWCSHNHSYINNWPFIYFSIYILQPTDAKENCGLKLLPIWVVLFPSFKGGSEKSEKQNTTQLISINYFHVKIQKEKESNEHQLKTQRKNTGSKIGMNTVVY